MTTLAVAIFASGAFVGNYVADWLYIDSCLDRGGKWNYAHENCEY